MDLNFLQMNKYEGLVKYNVWIPNLNFLFHELFYLLLTGTTSWKNRLEMNTLSTYVDNSTGIPHMYYRFITRPPQ